MSGQAAFAMNWPYVLAEAEANNSPVKGKTGWIPFPSETGKPQAALGGDMLAINAKSAHQAAAWALIQYLTSPQAQIQRALAAGDPPAVQAFPVAYNLWNSVRHVDLLEPGSHPFVGLENYRALLSDPDFRATFVRTMGYTVISVAIELVIGLGLALVIHERFRGRGVVRAAILIPWAVPAGVSAMLWSTMSVPPSGLVNYLLGVSPLSVAR